MVWKIILGIYVIAFIWMAYEVHRAPLYPDDFDDEMSDVNNEKKEH